MQAVRPKSGVLPDSAALHPGYLLRTYDLHGVDVGVETLEGAHFLGQTHDLLEMHRDVHGLFVEQFQEQEIVSVEPFQEIALELEALWMEPADDE